jgi:hypothetical protein
MASIHCVCEFEPVVVPEFDIEPVQELSGNQDTVGAGAPEDAPVDGEPAFDQGAFGLVADAGRDRDEDGDDSDFGFDDFDDEPDDDDLADDFDDDEDDDDLDDDLDDLDDDEDV